MSGLGWLTSVFLGTITVSLARSIYLATTRERQFVARADKDTCSDAWIRDQIRRRGLTGYSGAYHEDR